ncbi:MAG: sigma-70 family RNA polymerase sigma factor [Bacteroidetes bacterium]|nr:sigma-70 family RNA polymerase sigma factor [Bacteroidota bacterium]
MEKETPAEMEQALIQSDVTHIQNAEIGEAVISERAKLLSFIKSKVPAGEEAEDILQDVFYELIESRRLMKPIEKLASWLYTVARNKINDLYRKKKTVSLEDEFEISGSDEVLMLADVLPAFENSIEDKLLQSALIDLMEEALDELPENQSRAFIMHELEGKSLNEIAEEMDVPLKTVISRKRYAVLHLREKMQELYKELFH